jgi:hypothetical protein
MPRIDVGPFTKGLVTDTIGVEGALLEATDVVINRIGEVRKRGGKTANSSAVMASAISAVYDSFAFTSSPINANPQMIGSVYNGGYRIIAEDHGPLSSPTSLDPIQNGSGSTPAGFQISTYRFFQHGAELIGRSGNVSIKWAGSAHARYSVGTVSFTDGSATVTGVGTTWTSAHVGMYLWTTHATLGERSFRVTAVTSTTTLVIDQAADATAAGQSYALNPYGFLAAPDGFFFSLSEVADLNTVQAGAMCSHQDRVFAGATVEPSGISGVTYYNRLRWSADPLKTSGKFVGCDLWDANGYVDLPSGGTIKALRSFRGELLICTASALYVLRGSVAFDGTDLGASIELVADGVPCLSDDATCVTPYGVVIANQEGVFLWSGGYSVAKISDDITTSWKTDYSTSIRASYSPFGTRLIIFLDSSPTSAYVLDMERRVWTKQNLEADWSELGPVVSFVYSTGWEAAFALHNNYSLNWLTDRTGTGYDADSTSYPSLAITTHPIPLAKGMDQGRVDNVYLNGYVTDGASDNPLLDVSLVYGRKGERTGAESAVSVGSVSEGTFDKTTRLPVSGARNDYSAARIRVTQSGKAGTAYVYGLGLDVKPTRVIS